MYKHTVSLLLAVSSLMIFFGGCSKSDMVKKEEPVVPVANVAGTVKTESASKKPAIQSSKDSIVSETVNPITNAGELKAALENIYFDFDAHVLSPQARETLAKNSEMIKNDSAINVRIEGNCDERGSDDYNLALGEKRAKAAMQYLMTLGISEKRLSVISYGKEKPVVAGHDEASWAKNRRDDFVITSK
ncbi:peptidoglycan-associated lipoprotein Pal [Geomobilimonas luticola]|uniref:Peptidoglycan-associated lipoprotein n=1 Tax=Geomobilimonas luticola TaxID=1114878 RepID=A0ABS5SDI3_9BACT|nr:peptidoglycan-associated lipoprotein Pal [Geomobilimonas luticola]MBT0653430.1 peptidoglycan-associated lipoprotein Pal [Geomobilimonas luticola]